MNGEKEPVEGTGRVLGYTREGRETSLAAVSAQEGTVRKMVARQAGPGEEGLVLAKFVRPMDFIPNAMRRHCEVI